MIVLLIVGYHFALLIGALTPVIVMEVAFFPCQSFSFKTNVSVDFLIIVFSYFPNRAIMQSPTTL